MGFSRLFKPNVEKLKKKKNLEGLLKALRYGNVFDDFDATVNVLIRKEAAIALREVRDERSIEPLIQALKDDKNETVRHMIVVTLGVIGDKRAIKPLIQALWDKEPDIRHSAVRALGELGDATAVKPLFQKLKEYSADNEDTTKALQMIVNRDAIAVELLIQFLGDHDYHQFLRDHPNHGLRFVIPEIIEKMEDRTRSVKPLLQLLKAEDMAVRLCASEILVKIGDARAMSPLIRTLIQALKDKNRDYREKASIALGETKTVKELEPFIEPLIDALNDDSYVVRNNVVAVLGGIRDKRATEPLIQALADDKSRYEAICALGRVGDAKAVKHLIQILQLEGDDAAAIALGRIGDLLAVDPIIDWLFSGKTEFHFRGEDYFREFDFDRFKKFKNAFSKLFGEYTDLILKSAYYFKENKTNQVIRGSTIVAGTISQYDFQESDIAVETLCSIKTKISNNILHKISNKKDIRVEIQRSYHIQRDGMDDYTSYGELSFANQRDMAIRELSRRGNPPYDPSIYLHKEAWKL